MTVAYYEQLGLLRRIDGTRAPADVLDSIREVLDLPHGDKITS